MKISLKCFIFQFFLVRWFQAIFKIKLKLDIQNRSNPTEFTVTHSTLTQSTVQHLETNTWCSLKMVLLYREIHRERILKTIKQPNK